MEQKFTKTETYFIIFIIILTFIRALYMMYVYIIKYKDFVEIYSGENIFEKVKNADVSEWSKGAHL